MSKIEFNPDALGEALGTINISLNGPESMAVVVGLKLGLSLGLPAERIDEVRATMSEALDSPDAHDLRPEDEVTFEFNASQCEVISSTLMFARLIGVEQEVVHSLSDKFLVAIQTQKPAIWDTYQQFKDEVDRQVAQELGI